MRRLWGLRKVREEGARITIVIAPSWSGRARQFVLPLRVARILLVAGGAVIVIFLVLCAGVGTVMVQAHSARRLSVENDSLRAQFARLEQIDRELREIGEMDRKIRKLAGLEPSIDSTLVPRSGGAPVRKQTRGS